MPEVERSEGRYLFGRDPIAYKGGRPGYPARVFEILEARCMLGPGTAMFEIGPGTGQATQELLSRGAAPLTLVEPDAKFAAHLREAFPTANVIEAAFEESELVEAAYDLGVAATSFHWLEEELALRNVARVLRPGGCWAPWWNAFGDPDEPDEFHKATNAVMSALHTSRSAGKEGRPPYALDVDERVRHLRENGNFDRIEHERISWVLPLDMQGIRALYSTFSEVARLETDEKARLLDALSEIAERDFDGRIEKKILTSVYTARRI